MVDSITNLFSAVKAFFDVADKMRINIGYLLKSDKKQNDEIKKLRERVAKLEGRKGVITIEGHMSQEQVTKMIDDKIRWKEYKE